MILKNVLSLSLLYLQLIHGEIITIGTYLASTALIGGSWYNWNTLKDHTYCRFTECCNDDYIPYDLESKYRIVVKVYFKDF